MQPANRQRTYLALIILVSLLAIFFSILLTTVIIIFTGSQLNIQNPAPTALYQDIDSPVDILDVEKIDPALALTSLGGVPEKDVIVEAIQKSRPETALSTLLFYPFLANREAAGDYLLLAAAYERTDQLPKAIFSYQMAGTIATISPDMPDNVRADLFLQASEGLIRINQPEIARFYLEQSFTLALYSPYLQAVQRRTIFERLQRNYLQLEERELAHQSLTLSANPPAITPLANTVMVLPTSEPLSTSSTAQEAEAARWLAAQQLAALLVERAGDAPDSAYEALRQALLKEDDEKIAYLDNEFAVTTQLTQKINIIAAKIEWLATKYRIAQQGYGVSLVPEWETNTFLIQQDLAENYVRLFTLYDELIVALPDVAQINQATAEKLRQQILFGELGHYPNYPAQQLRQQLGEVNNRLLANQPELNLFMGTTTLNGQEFYTLEARNEP